MQVNSDFFDNYLSNEYLNDVFMSREENFSTKGKVEKYFNPSEIFELVSPEPQMVDECREHFISVKMPLKDSFIESGRLFTKALPIFSSKAFTVQLESYEFMREAKVLKAINDSLDKIGKIVPKYGYHLMDWDKDNKILDGELERYHKRINNAVNALREFGHFTLVMTLMYLAPCTIFGVVSSILMAQMVKNISNSNHFSTDLSTWRNYYKGRVMVYAYGLGKSIYGYTNLVANKRNEKGQIKITSLRLVKVGGILHNKNSFESYNGFNFDFDL